MAGGVEDGGVGVLMQEVGEVAGDASQYLVDDPGPAVFDCGAGGAGLVGAGLALHALAAIPGRSGQTPSEMQMWLKLNFCET